MSNKYYNKQTAPSFQYEDGWSTGTNKNYSGSGKNGAGAYNSTGSPKDKKGGKGARNGADKSGRKGKTFSENFK